MNTGNSAEYSDWSTFNVKNSEDVGVVREVHVYNHCVSACVRLVTGADPEKPL